MRELPDCATWYLPAMANEDGYARLNRWQAGRCGMCGGSDLRTRPVMDHDHMTGLVRGYLCRGCNTSEPHSVSPAWNAWRDGVNPAGILEVVEEYRFLHAGQKFIEEAMRLPTSDADLDVIADAVTR